MDSCSTQLDLPRLARVHNTSQEYECLETWNLSFGETYLRGQASLIKHSLLIYQVHTFDWQLSTRKRGSARRLNTLLMLAKAVLLARVLRRRKKLRRIRASARRVTLAFSSSMTTCNNDPRHRSVGILWLAWVRPEIRESWLWWWQWPSSTIAPFTSLTESTTHY